MPRSILLLVAAALLLTACAAPSAPSAPAAPAASPQPLESVKLGYSVLSAANSALFAAAEAGFYERNGLDVELVLLGAGQPAEAALISGEIPAASTSPISALNAVVAGGDVTVVGAVFDLVAYQIVSSRDVASLPDLRGKTMAINRLGGSPHSALRLIMATAGVDLDREVRVVQTGGQLERVAAVRNGAAQATLVEPPFAQQAESEGLRLLADSSDMRIAYPITALVVNRQWLNGRRDTARRVLQSVVDGNRAFRTDKELGLRTVQRRFQVDDPALVEATYAYFSRMLPDYVLPAPEGIQRVLDEIPPEQLAGRQLAPSDLVDASLAREVR